VFWPWLHVHQVNQPIHQSILSGYASQRKYQFSVKQVASIKSKSYIRQHPGAYEKTGLIPYIVFRRTSNSLIDEEDQLSIVTDVQIL
jgi:hypothetical protein